MTIWTATATLADMISPNSPWVVLSVNLIGSLGIGSLFGALVGGYLSRKSTALQERQKQRLEKEYEIYGKLWETLFEMRRAIVAVLDDPTPMQEVVDALNAYQAVVRRNEPFISASVYEPAREILRLGRTMIRNEQHDQELQQKKATGFVDNERVTERQIKLHEENLDMLEKIEELMSTLLAAIRARIGD